MDFVSALGSVFAAALDWFVKILNSTGTTELYMSVIFISLVMALLIKPLRGASNGSNGDD